MEPFAVLDFDKINRNMAANRKADLRARQLMGVDFEGQSLLDISDVGATQYAAHPSTDILCLGYQEWLTNYTDAPTLAPPIWHPEGGRFPAELEDAVRSEEWTFVAHHAQFDRTVWDWFYRRGILPVEPPKHWLCTAQRASINGLPRGLDEACKALGLPGKDKEGAAVLMRWCKPFKRGKTTTFTPRRDIPSAEFAKIMAYCGVDILRMWGVLAATQPATAQQIEYAELDYEINQRGFGVDMAGVDKAIARLNEAQMELRQRVLDTAGEPINLQSPDQMHEFCRQQRWPMAKMDAHHIRVALADPACPPLVRSMLELRQLAALKASSKFAAFRQRGMEEGEHLVIRDWAVVDAAHTGRHSAKGYQAHNMKREIASPEAVDCLLNEPLETTRLLYDEPLRLAGMSVRPMVIARKPEHVLLIGDFAKIELCTLFWYAKELKALEELANGVDLYKRLASVIYKKAEALITKEERQLGKTGVLGNGYGLGDEGFQRQLTEKYGINIDLPTSGRAVYGYRDMFPGVPRFWRKLGHAMVQAVTNKGTPYKLGPLKIVASDKQMVIVLPDGSKIRYQKPFIRGSDVWYWAEDDRTKQFVPTKFWGGAATGHVVQATANRLQRCAAFDLRAANFDIVLHAHDELVCEDVPERLPEFKSVMAMEGLARRPWMEGMLIEVDAVATRRYRKG